jgi:hypothetical protein
MAKRRKRGGEIAAGLPLGGMTDDPDSATDDSAALARELSPLSSMTLSAPPERT